MLCQLFGLSPTTLSRTLVTGWMTWKRDMNSSNFGLPRPNPTWLFWAISLTQPVSQPHFFRSSHVKRVLHQLIALNSTTSQVKKLWAISLSMWRMAHALAVSLSKVLNGTLRSCALWSQKLWSWPAQCQWSTSNPFQRDRNHHKESIAAPVITTQSDRAVSVVTPSCSRSNWRQVNTRQNSGSSVVPLC